MWGIHFFRYVGWDVAFFSIPLALNGPPVNDFTIILLASEMHKKNADSVLFCLSLSFWFVVMLAIN